MMSFKAPAMGLLGCVVAGVVVVPGHADEPSVVPSTLVSGVLTDGSGRPAAGAVQVTAWPLEPSTGRSEPVLASARTDARGRFRLATTDVERLRSLASPEQRGRLDLEVEGVTTSGHEGRWVFSAFVRPAVGRAADRSTGSAGSAPRIFGAPFDDARPRTVRIRAAHAVSAARRTTIMRAAARITPPGEGRGETLQPVEICPPYTWKTQGTKVASTPIGELNNAYNDTRARFTYGRTADTEVTVAAGKGSGAFAFSGSTTVANTVGTLLVRSPKGRYSRRLYSNFEYEYRTKPTCGGEALREVRARRWIGSISSKPQRRTLNVCDRTSPYKNAYAGGDSFSRTAGKATTYGGEVNVFGATLNARSGFSENVRISYRFGGSPRKKHYICGAGDTPPTDGGRIFSGPAR